MVTAVLAQCRLLITRSCDGAVERFDDDGQTAELIWSLRAMTTAIRSPSIWTARRNLLKVLHRNSSTPVYQVPVQSVLLS